MKQIFGYTAPEANQGETYVKVLAVHEIGDCFQFDVRNGSAEWNTILMPKKQAAALIDALKEAE